MRTHDTIDARSLALARVIAARIDADPQHEGLERARRVCRRWKQILPSTEHAAVDEWLTILDRPWPEVKIRLLDAGEEGKRRRQNSPFTGLISNRERWRILKEFSDDARAA